MWIVRLALRRPYTFVVTSILLLILGPVAILRTPTDIFPNIDIPVVSVLWNYTGLSPEEMSNRIVFKYERVLTTTVNNIEHIESQSLNGIAVVKIFFHSGVNIGNAVAQVTAVSQTLLRQLPPGTTPPLVIQYNASSVPILQLALAGEGLSEQQLGDIGLNFVRTGLVSVPGAAIPYPYGGKQRQVQVDLNTAALQSKGLSPNDVVTAINAQNLILPAGTAKIGTFEYEVDMNGAPRTVPELNDLPVKTVGTTTIYIHDVANVRDGFPPQTNIVRVNGQRSALMTILKSGDASTLDIISNVKALLPSIKANFAARAGHQPTFRSIHLREGLHRRRGSRSDHRRLPHRLHDSGVPGKLAQHVDHCRFHSAFDPHVADRSQRARRNDQYHDARRTGAGRGHPGGRRHRGN